MVWGPGYSNSFAVTGRGSRWWHGKEVTTENPYSGREAWSRGDPLLPTIFNVVVDTVVRL